MVMGKYGDIAKRAVEQLCSIIKHIHTDVLPSIAPGKLSFEISY
jgi:hypothetical protein